MSQLEITLKKNKEVSQTFNLNDLFGRKVEQSEADAFFELVKERIIERSQFGLDVNDNPFADYSPEYAEFKGVSVGDVDMTLSSDMLENIEYEFKNGILKVKVNEDDAGKAYGHMTGFKGHPTIKNGPQREFFGVQDDEAALFAEMVGSDSGITAGELAPDQFTLEEIISGLRIGTDGEG
jgi:hypothetical protein